MLVAPFVPYYFLEIKSFITSYAVPDLEIYQEITRGSTVVTTLSIDWKAISSPTLPLQSCEACPSRSSLMAYVLTRKLRMAVRATKGYRPTEGITLYDDHHRNSILRKAANTHQYKA